MKKLFRAVIWLGSALFSLACTVLILGCILGFVVYSFYSKDLPDYRQLANYNPSTVTRLYAGDGKVLAEYASEKRVFVPLTAIPKRVIQAFISAEDKSFYNHTGIDITGIARAIRDNVVHYGKGKSLVGGSTITQQVVKNFLLTNEKSIERKVKEAILALRISRVYSKEKILELYLNEIYLGMSSYGVAAAAQNYFNKSLDELALEEIALLAAQPKAPSVYDPIKNYNAAKERRDWVIDRMQESGYATKEEATAAKQAPIALRKRDTGEVADAGFFAEAVRRWLAQMYGADALYTGGLVVKTTLDPKLQKYADTALQKALIEYDRRHGYRGVVTHLSKSGKWQEQMVKLGREQSLHLIDGQRLALVTGIDSQKLSIAFDDDAHGTIPFSSLKWTGAKKTADVAKPGDVVIVEPGSQKKTWDLVQVPEINGAMVVLDPHTGRVLAMSGGYSYGSTEFNRAMQAKRQPGSAFKPFVYLAGLENGFTPTTVIDDSPIEISQGEGLPMWSPQNFEGEHLGPATMRVGLEKSRNTMTVRMAQIIGIDKALEIGKRFGIYDKPPRNFSIVLGSMETTLLRLVNAYGMLANGGKRIEPSIVERIDDRHGATIFRRDTRACDKCRLEALAGVDISTPPPLEDLREQIADPRIVYQIISMLEGVTTRGTGARARDIGKIVAGKTGTTNESQDAWFVGFSPDLVTGVYIGYDKPRTLGRKETGGSVALPAFIGFMKQALADVPNKPFTIPRGIQLMQVDLQTGTPVAEMLVPPEKTIEEAFISGGPIFIPGITPQPQPDKSPMNALTLENSNQQPVPPPPAEKTFDALDGSIPAESQTLPQATGGGLY